MPILKHMILLGNILSLLTLVRYLYVSFIVFVLGFGNTSGFGVIAFLALFFLSFYPIIVILCTLYSWLSRNDEKVFSACCIAYIPVVIALLYYAYQAYK